MNCGGGNCFLPSEFLICENMQIFPPCARVTGISALLWVPFLSPLMWCRCCFDLSLLSPWTQSLHDSNIWQLSHSDRNDSRSAAFPQKTESHALLGGNVLNVWTVLHVTTSQTQTYATLSWDWMLRVDIWCAQDGFRQQVFSLSKL